MQKRGQLSVFIIVGLLLLIGVSLTVYLTQRTTPSVAEEKARSEDPQTQLEGIVESCVEKQGIFLLQLMARRGGTLVPGRLYRGENYNYLCIETPENGCVNTLHTKRDMAAEFDVALQPLLDKCLGFKPLEEKGFAIERGSLNTTSIIGYDEVTVTVQLPVTMVRGEEIKSFDSFAVQILTPYGKLHSLAQWLLNQQVRQGFMDKDTFMTQHGYAALIGIDRPYPDTLIKLTAKDPVFRVYDFHYGMLGINTVRTPIAPRPAVQHLDTCLVDLDCYDNVPAEACSAKHGELVKQDDPRCKLPFEESTECPGGTCRDCETQSGKKKHGEQWCDATVERVDGLDPVGSRFMKKSCHNGHIQNEPCRDFREEFCTQEDDIAACRQNRWQDCWSQTEQQSCEDLTQRDCFWTDTLVPNPRISFHTPTRTPDRCRPIVGPGLEIWRGAGKEVCRMASEQVREEIGVFSQALSWKPPVVHSNGQAQYCYSMGDCGNKVSVLDFQARKRYKSTTGKPNPALTEPAEDTMLRLPLIVGPFGGITDSTFYYPQGVKSYMKKQTRDYINWLLSLDPIAVILDQVPLHIIHSAYCKGWLPTKAMGNNCGLCEKYDQGCSEYLCRALGKKCRFAWDARGFPHCELAADPPTLERPQIEIINRTYTETNEGWRITEPMNPYELLNMRVRTESPSICTISFFRGMNELLPDSEDDQLGPLMDILQGTIEMFAPASSDAHFSEFREPLREQFLTIEIQDFSFLRGLQNETPLLLLANPAKLETFLRDKAFGQALKDPVIGPKAEGFVDVASELLGKLGDELANSAFGSLTGKAELLVAYAGLKKDPMIGRMYVNCVDDGGDEVAKSVVIEIPIKRDELPPIVMNVTPEPPGPLAGSLQVITNEPAECSFSVDQDTTYDLMTPMSCDYSRWSTRTCTTNGLTGKHQVFIRCEDRPFAFMRGAVIIKPSGPPKVFGASIIDVTNAINITASSLSRTLSVELATQKPSMTFQVSYGWDYQCRIGITNSTYGNLPTLMHCTGSTCTTDIVTSAPTTYYYVCADLDSPYRNTNQQSFIYNYDKE